MADAELTARYRDILTAGFRASAGAPISDSLESAAEASILSSAERLAEQLENSILDAPWMRSEIQSVIGDWMTGDSLNMADLRDALEPVFGPARALMIARTETAQVWNGANAAGLRAHGWESVVWVASSDACDECAAADGEIMSIGEYEADPTLHPNCSCTAVPYQEEEDQGEEEEG